MPDYAIVYGPVAAGLVVNRPQKSGYYAARSAFKRVCGEASASASGCARARISISARRISWAAYHYTVMGGDTASVARLAPACISCRQSHSMIVLSLRVSRGCQPFDKVQQAGPTVQLLTIIKYAVRNPPDSIDISVPAGLSANNVAIDCACMCCFQQDRPGSPISTARKNYFDPLLNRRKRFRFRIAYPRPLHRR